MPEFSIGEHVQVTSRGLYFYGKIIAYHTYGKYWLYTVESFCGLHVVYNLREFEIATIEC